VLYRPTAPSLATLSSHIDKALDLSLVDYTGDADMACKLNVLVTELKHLAVLLTSQNCKLLCKYE